LYLLHFDEVGCENVDNKDEDEDEGFHRELLDHG
jgi:hypothetical protein